MVVLEAPVSKGWEMSNWDASKMDAILALSEEELNALSDHELGQIAEILEYGMDADYITQYSLKILINALYGALANKHFLLANPDMAAGVTSSGRFFIQLLAIRLEESLQAMIPSGKPYISYGDTDSVSGDTALDVGGIAVTIEKLYNTTNPTEGGYFVTPRGCEVKKVEGLKSLTYTIEDGLMYKPIKYVMRHKVNKQMYKIKSNGQELEVTADHSLKIIRNGKLEDVKPYEIQKGDKIVKVMAG